MTVSGAKFVGGFVPIRSTMALKKESKHLPRRVKSVECLKGSGGQEEQEVEPYNVYIVPVTCDQGN